MPPVPDHHLVPLARNPGYQALLRSEDFGLLFLAGEDDHPDPETLFAAHRDLLLDRQPTQAASAGKRTLTLYMVLTDRCNLGCTYCDVLGRPDQRRQGVVMSQAIADRAMEILLARLRSDPELEAQVTFFGGEPLLAWDALVHICETLAASGENHRISRMLVTNGTLMTTERAAYLLEQRVYVVVSLDGRPRANDSVRRTLDGSPSSPLVERGMDLLNQVMPGRWGISCTVGSHNAATLAEETTWLQRRFRPLSIGLNIYHWQQDGTVGIAMDDHDLGQALLAAFRVARREGISIYQFIGIVKAFTHRRRNLDYCPACVDKLLFSPAGRVGRCETLMFDERFSVPLDRVEDHRLPDALDWTAYTPEHEPACQACFARWVCPGSCAYDQYVTTGSLSGVQARRCAFQRAILVELLDLLLEETIAAHGQRPVLVPSQAQFDRVPGAMPTSFPADTIWIVSMAAVGEEDTPPSPPRA